MRLRRSDDRRAFEPGGLNRPAQHARRHRLLLPLLALLLSAVGSAPGLARRPYFTQPEAVLLPDGQPGEMRILHGDGILLADPARIVVLDRGGRLLARSHRSAPVSLVCHQDRKSCWGYDHGANRVLTLDPARFRYGGPFVPGTAERDGLWDLEGGEENWGFAVRSPSIAEYLEAEWALARRVPTEAMACLVALGATMAAMGGAFLRAPRSRKPWRLGLWAASTLLQVAGLGVAVVLALYIAVLLGLSPTLCLAGLAAGGAPVLLVSVLRRLARTPPAASPAASS